MVSRPYDEPTEDNPEWTDSMFAKARPGREILPPEVLSASKMQPAVSQPALRFEIYQADQEWRWRLSANNNEVLAVGEGYRTKQDCELAVELVKRAAADAPTRYFDAA